MHENISEVKRRTFQSVSQEAKHVVDLLTAYMLTVIKPLFLRLPTTSSCI